jgi:glycosyltransferase involved in cell wall biosynthesis
MKVFFPVFQWAKPSMRGVIKKVSDQTRALSGLVEDVYTVVYGFHDPDILTFDNLNYVNIKPSRENYILQLWQVRKKSFELALKEIERYNPDIIYTRYLLGDPSSVSFLNRIPRSIPLIFEQQAIPAKELKVLNKPIYVLLESVFGRRLVNLSSGVVGVTEGIMNYESRRMKNHRAILVPNGIGVNSVPLRHPPAFDPKGLEILFVGSTNSWHGLDRLLFGLKAYKGEVKINLHIVGIEEDNSLRELAETLRIKERIHFYGFKNGNELDAYFDNCHIGAGSFGIQRKGLTESAGLKMRTYCARGLPFFLGHKDPDFSPDFPFCAFFPASEEPIDFRSVVKFYETVYSRPDHPELMRDFAQKNLDWSVKMKKTIEFFEQILAERKAEK